MINEYDLQQFKAYIKEQNISIDSRIPVNYQGLKPFLSDGPPLIVIAAYCSSQNIFNYLLQEGADLFSSGFYHKPILHYALAGRNTGIIQKLLDSSIDMRYSLSATI